MHPQWNLNTPKSDNGVTACDRPCILLVADFAFMPAVSGNTKRVASLVSAIRSWGYTVHFLGLGSNWSDSAVAATQAAVDTFTMHEWNAKLDPYGLPASQLLPQRAWRWMQRRLCQCLGLWPPALDPDLPQRCPNSFCGFVQEKAHELKPVAVIAEYLWLSRCLVDLPPGIHRIIDSHDLMHQRLLQYRGSGLHSFFQCTLSKELKCLRRADAVLVIQEEEKRLLIPHLQNTQLISTPHGHDIVPPSVRNRTNHLLFAGSGHSANIEGLQWFLHSIWPIILEQDSTVGLTLAGGCCNGIAGFIDYTHGRPRVNVLGIVDDLVAEYHKADVLINPILRGSGLKIKVVEALCCGMGVVSTTKGVEGIKDIEQCQSIRVADRPEQFAEATLALLRSKDNISESSMHFASQQFSIRAAYKDLQTLLNDSNRTCEHQRNAEAPLSNVGLHE